MKRVFKSRIFLCLFTATLCICGCVLADELLNARDILYAPNNGEFDVSNVKDALDTLYEKSESNVENKFCSLKTGEPLHVGSKYECDLGDGIRRNFYILTNKGKIIDLISEYNIANKITWYEAMKYFTSGSGVTYKNSWTNVIDISMPTAQAIADAANFGLTISDSGLTWWCLGDHKIDSQNNAPWCTNNNQSTYAWIFNHIDGCSVEGCTDDSDAGDYYWTSDIILNSKSARIVHGYIGTTDVTYQLGLRPVITVLKDNL